MDNMMSFFGEQTLKDAVVARVKAHQELDQIVQGTYWDGTRGCSIGCALHSSNHMAFETQLGLPVFLAYMNEHIFERLPLAEAKQWPLRLIEAVPVGVDLELVFPRFMHWLLSDPHGMRQYADAQTVPIIDAIAAMYARRIDGTPFDITAAWAAGTAAGKAGAGWVGWAAEAAAWAADAPAGAADAAACAAWAAEYRPPCEAAGAAQLHRQADYLIRLLRSYETSAPCEDEAADRTYATTKEARHD